MPDLIIGDAAQLTSDAIVRFKRLLKPVRAAVAPFLFLIHGNAARAEAQARLLGADDTLSATSAIEQLQDQGGSPIATELAAAARLFFVQTFFSGRAVTPELASTGAELVMRAVQQCGIRDWISAVRRFDEATQQHCLIVAGLSAAFAIELGLHDFDSSRLTKAALVHDVGKTKIPLSILNKPGRLTEPEMTVMRMHAAIGYEMLVDSGFSQEVLQVVRSHHEMLDGSGYPDGLRAPEIPDLVRLVTICDIYGALIERRPYRPAMTGREAYSIVQSMTGRLDADLVNAFRPVIIAFDPNGA
ncbi:HDIG domain-containing protein [Methylobacterium sp. 13MFTsu3.1M2]|nr:HDIG domain-containing protein [Methylobacterium sp. 13MFTsu3.1M2]